MRRLGYHAIRAVAFWIGISLSSASGEIPEPKRYGKGNPFQVQDLPSGKLKAQLEKIKPTARTKAVEWLHTIQFEEFDAKNHLRVDEGGGVFIICPDNQGNCDGDNHAVPLPPSVSGGGGSSTIETGEAEEVQPGSEPYSQSAPVPVASPPAFSSKPSASRHIYLDFNGANVSGKDWSATDGITTWRSWDCAAWGTDGDSTTFTDFEQAEIRRVWERISEDYAPFDINVTTDTAYDPVNYTGDKNKVGWLLFTATIDKRGARCPHFDSGGVAYVGAFGRSDYFSTYQPAWVTPTSAANMAEAGSHEMGHNLGVTHDGTTAPQNYYGGHNATSSAPSWGPIMGTGYGRNVSQWSKGEYYRANQFQDDLAIISQKVPYRADDHGDSFSSATILKVGKISQQGIVERSGNADFFSFNTGAGTISFTAAGFKSDVGTWGGNLDIQLELYDNSQTLIASSNPTTDVAAAISRSVAAGNYFLVLRPSAVGSPMSTSPSGYTQYGSLGQYTLTGTVVPINGIALTSPIGGETWNSSTTRSITWESAMGGNVKIELFKNGLLSATVTTGTPNDGSHDWTIPSGFPPGNNYRIRISSVDDPSLSDMSLADFSIVSPPAYFASMDSNPGWTFSHSSWAYGRPTGAEQDGYGNPDPSSGYNGANVVGYRLDGDYEANISGTRWATTPAIDCTNFENVTLRFKRWLGIESSTYDRAYIQVSNNGSTWTTIWENPNSDVADVSWQDVQYDISAVADGRPTVFIRWGIGSTDGYWNYSGWNIDEVIVDGDRAIGVLDVSPSGSVQVSGTRGGPFSPSSVSYTVTNTGNSPLTWTAARSANWMSLSTSGGILAAAASTRVTVSLNENANTLLPSLYGGTISFTNTSSGAGGAFREILLEVLSAGNLEVTSSVGFDAAGQFGGSFSPTSRKFTLSNTGETTISWTADKTTSWVDLSSTGGSLAAGATTEFTVSLNAKTQTLGVGSHSDIVTFTNSTNGNGNTTRVVGLTVNPIPVTVDLGNLSTIYDGSPKPVTVTTNPVGVAYSADYTPSGIPLKAGTYPVTVTVTEPNHVGMATGSLKIAKATHTINFPALKPVDEDQPPFESGASASSGLPVSISSSKPEVATVFGNTITVVGTGITELMASQPGNENYEPAEQVKRTLIVFKKNLAEAVIFEPFDDLDTTLAGNVSGRGFLGTWAGSALVDSETLEFGRLPAGTGGRVTISNQNGYASIGDTLASNGLLQDGASLWFSLIVETGGDITKKGDLGFALGTDPINPGTELPSANKGSALGVTFNGNQIRASHWSPETLSRSSGSAASPTTKYLIVGKFTWGASYDSIEIYKPSTELSPGMAVSALTTANNLDQSLFDTISFASKSAYPAHHIDEIRFGASYESVIGIGISGEVDHFDISPIDSPQTVGIPITGITITARTATNATARGFNGAVMFGGTGGFSGTSASFIEGVLTDVIVTPTESGNDLTLTVDDSVGHFGQTTISTIASKFESWSGSIAFNNDGNGDGIADGLAWVLGAKDADANASALLPKLSIDEGIVSFKFLRNQESVSSSTSVSIEVGTTLDSWAESYVVGATTADSAQGVTVLKDTPVAGTDTVSLTIQNSTDSKKFFRLKVEQGQ